MLKKIQHIKKLGVFKDFSWDSEVKNKGGAVQNFVDINIIYGRNYSGNPRMLIFSFHVTYPQKLSF